MNSTYINTSKDFYDELGLEHEELEQHGKYSTCIHDLQRIIEIALGHDFSVVHYKDGGSIEFAGMFCKYSLNEHRYDFITLYSTVTGEKRGFKCADAFATIMHYVQFLEEVFNHLVASGYISKEQLDKNVTDIRINMAQMMDKLYGGKTYEV